MKKQIYLVTRAVYENRGLGLDIKSDEDILIESESLEEAQKEFDFRKSQLRQNLSYTEANENYFHKDMMCIALTACTLDDDDYDDFDYLDSVYSLD